MYGIYIYIYITQAYILRNSYTVLSTMSVQHIHTSRRSKLFSKYFCVPSARSAERNKLCMLAVHLYMHFIYL